MNQHIQNKYFYILIAPPIGSLGDQIMGGVNQDINVVSDFLIKENHDFNILVGGVNKNHRLEKYCKILNGNKSITACGKTELSKINNENTLLINIINYLKNNNKQLNIFVINFAFDQPIYKFLMNSDIRYCCFVTICAIKDHHNEYIYKMWKKSIKNIAFHNNEQAETYGIKGDVQLLNYPLPDNIYDKTIQKSNIIDFIWIGRISQEKGLEYAIKAVKKLGGKLVVIGKYSMIQLKKDINSEHVDYRGPLSHCQVLSLLKKSRIMLSTPLWDEAFGRNILEAVSCGCNVVSFTSPGPKYILKDISGSYVVNKTVDDLVFGIKKVLMTMFPKKRL